MGHRTLLLLAAWLAAGWAQDAVVEVDTTKPGQRVSSRLYGVFFEEVNHAGDGGLYAELLRNRAFLDAAAPVGWDTVSIRAEGQVALTDDQPLNAQQPRSLRLDLRRVEPGGRLGVANSGYWGLPVRAGQVYTFGCWTLKRGPLPVRLQVALQTATGRDLAAASIADAGDRWSHSAVALVAGESDPAARLVVSLTAPGSVQLAATSLMPPTWKGRPNGLRPDLARLVADLRPAFVRFPGGCFVEGDKLANAARWKLSIGDVSTRPGHRNLWGYRSTDGLGYHEYLQMCEDLGAEPLFVINCGMAHEDVVPLDQLQPWVDDALDAIEYANGPVTSRWGALRAAAGHPAPFGLRLLEIGNENSGPAYEERYARFWDAIKARYPQLTLIANVPVKSRPMDIVDEHYYSSPAWFAGQANRYDQVRRDGPQVYVGEYAVTSECGTGNLRAALGEAAFMCGLERNSDLVVMASYAPLFVHQHQRTWNPDAIVFDSAGCYGTPSYHVQKLFSAERPAVVLPTRAQTGVAPAGPRGAIGLATWQTQAEFKDVTVTAGDRTLYRSAFERGTTGWTMRRGQWSCAGGALRQMSLDTDLQATSGDRDWSDYTLSLKARKLSGNEGFLIMFHVRGHDDWVWWNLGGWGNRWHGIERSAGHKYDLGTRVDGRIETGRWYDIRIELQGAHIRCFLDGRLIQEADDRAPAPFVATAGRLTDGSLVVKMVNLAGAWQDTVVRLNGFRPAARGRSICLTGLSPEDENSLAQPLRVAPVEQAIMVPGPRLRPALPPHSLTILHLPAQ